MRTVLGIALAVILLDIAAGYAVGANVGEVTQGYLQTVADALQRVNGR